MLLPDEEQPGALRSEQPLMPVRRQKIDAVGLHVERKNAEPLNRIQKKQAADAVAKLGDLRGR